MGKYGDTSLYRPHTKARRHKVISNEDLKAVFFVCFVALRDKSVSFFQERETSYLHPAQDEDEHPPHPEPDDDADSDDPPERPMPKRDSRFSVRSDPHFSQATAGFAPNTSFSKSTLQALQ
jgi:hypothetical protein